MADFWVLFPGCHIKALDSQVDKFSNNLYLIRNINVPQKWFASKNTLSKEYIISERYNSYISLLISSQSLRKRFITFQSGTTWWKFKTSGKSGSISSCVSLPKLVWKFRKYFTIMPESVLCLSITENDIVGF